MQAASEIIKWKQYCYAYNIFLCPSITHIPIKFCVCFFFSCFVFLIKILSSNWKLQNSAEANSKTNWNWLWAVSGTRVSASAVFSGAWYSNPKDSLIHATSIWSSRLKMHCGLHLHQKKKKMVRQKRKKKNQHCFSYSVSAAEFLKHHQSLPCGERMQNQP